jgi:spore coat polysaccharide biosynthesis protein SpsF
MNLVIIQARMGSTRLPGKVLMELTGIPMLLYQVNRVKKSKKIDDIVIATTTNEADNLIVQFCIQNNLKYFRGSEHDVLDRYYQCAQKFKGNTIIRLTADCPFSDPVVIDRTIDLFQKTSSDYCANTVPPENSGWPDGSDVEVFSYEALKKAHRDSKEKNEREHVTFYFWKGEGRQIFKRSQLISSDDNSKYRFTVDYPKDYELAKKISEILKKQNLFGHCDEIIAILHANLSLQKLNSEYYFGIGWNER